jgi:hypothetical protein
MKQSAADRPNEGTAVEKAAAQFPAEFGLRAYPGKVFCISLSASYVSDYPAANTIMLYTAIKTDKGGWAAFCKGTPSELRSQLVKL